MRTRRDGWLVGGFAGYVVLVGLLFLFTPRLLDQPYLMPWDYWWVFLFVTPVMAAGLLVWQMQAGRFSGWAVAVFMTAVVLLGAFLGWFSLELSGVV